MTLLSTDLESRDLVEEMFDLYELPYEETSREVFYEHGQWWARAEVITCHGNCCSETLTFSVVDVAGSVHGGLGFEEV